MKKDSVVGQRFEVKELLGCGSFGQVSAALDKKTNQKVAIKFEVKDHTRRPVLFHEAEVMRNLKGEGIPKVISVGQTDTHNYLVEEILNQNLSDLAKCALSLKRTMDILNQCITRLEHIHEHKYLHNDVKPQNFCLGDDLHTIYLVDFGLARKYIEGEMNVHVIYRENIPFAGTASYASLNVHMGVQPSRRDDLESVLLVSLFLLKGKLPWQGLKRLSKTEKELAIRRLKLVTPIEILCAKAPRGILESFKYVRGLKFTEKPDYVYIRKLFGEISKEEFPLSSVFPQHHHLRTPKKSLSDANLKSKTGNRKPRLLHGLSQSLFPLCIVPVQPSDFDDSPCDDEDVQSQNEESTVVLVTFPALRREKISRYDVSYL